MIEPFPLFCGMATLYLAGTLTYGAYLTTERGLLLRLGKGFWVAAFAVHSFFLMLSARQVGRVPAGDLFEASSFFAWAIVLAAFLSSLRYRIRLLGVFVLPLAFFLIVVAGFRSHERIFWNGSFSTVYFGLHTALLFLSYAAFALAFVTALMYLLLEGQIKSKRIGRFYRHLPSLELLEKANCRFVGLGWGAYGCGILFGLLWSRVALGHWFNPDPKIGFAFLTLGFYGTLFLGQSFRRLHGRKGMVLSVVFFLWVIASFIGVSHPTVFSVLPSAAM